MRSRSGSYELLHTVDGYNRLSLRKAWSGAKSALMKIRFDRLKLSYGDSRIDYRDEQKRRFSEGLKICR
ncbi:MAG: hypothetical protein JXA61_03560 [Bacteroidales bacterium]|nr:hypothetical protein [Bacteroidales bacterium]